MIYTKLTALPNYVTPWSRVLLEKVTLCQLAKKFFVFYGIRRCITAFTSAHHLSLSRACPDEASHSQFL